MARPHVVFSSLLTSLVLLLVPLLIGLERMTPDTWTQRLLLPDLEEKIARHTPRFSHGTYLPPQIKANTTLTPAQNPVLVAQATTVLPGSTLAIQPGTHVYVHEFGNLTIQGRLVIAGNAQQPVWLQTNELHPANQTWGGIIFTDQSTGTITYAQITDASPGISCLGRNQVAINHTTITRASLGLFTASAQCTITNSRLGSVRDGVISIGQLPATNNLSIFARRLKLQQITTPITP